MTTISDQQIENQFLPEINQTGRSLTNYEALKGVLLLGELELLVQNDLFFEDNDSGVAYRYQRIIVRFKKSSIPYHISIEAVLHINDD